MANTLQLREDMLRLIAQKVKAKLVLKKAPIHFFDKDGGPLQHIDRVLHYAAHEKILCGDLQTLPIVYCQDRLLFRWEYIQNQGIVSAEQLMKQDNPKVIEVDVNKSLTFKSTVFDKKIKEKSTRKLLSCENSVNSRTGLQELL